MHILGIAIMLMNMLIGKRRVKLMHITWNDSNDSNDESSDDDSSNFIVFIASIGYLILFVNLFQKKQIMMMKLTIE